MSMPSRWVSGLFVSVALAAFGCASSSNETVEPGSSGDPIIGGTLTTGDPAIGILVAQEGQGQYICTVTLVAPTVVLTAAHCVVEATPATKMVVYFGADIAQASQATVYPVTSWHAEPTFNLHDLGKGHDAAVLILGRAATATPIPMNKTPLTQAMVGGSVRIVGYGNDDGLIAGGSGVKRQVTTTLKSFDDVIAVVGDMDKTTCQGDSGGPTLMTINGQTRIIGTTSYGAYGCGMPGSIARADVSALWVDGFIVRAAGTAQQCVAVCSARTCGDNRCGGSCGSCGAGQICGNGTCLSADPRSCDATHGWEAEPNNDPSQVNAVCASRTINGAIDAPTDVDWYRFTVPANNSYRVTLGDLPGDFTMRIYEQRNDQLARLADATTAHDLKDQELSGRPSATTVYFLAVHGVGLAFNNQSGYSVTTTITP